LLTGLAGLAALPARAAQGSAIDDGGFVPIGGIDQWISLRGSDRRNPILLFLHGGPAAAQSPFLSLYTAWERDYTVAHWDQRGAGKTYGRTGAATPGMTLERMADDAGEVAEHLRQRLDGRKVVLVGHSWGSLLGLKAVERRPEAFALFVGTGQISTSWAESISGQYAYLRRRALTEGDKEASAALAAIDPLDPADRTHVGVVRRWLNHYMPATDKAYLKIQNDYVGQPPYPTTGDRGDWIGGQSFSGPRLMPMLMGDPLGSLERRMSRPFLLIQGREDLLTPSAPARAYLDRMTAPRKGFAEIDGGHFAAMSNPEGFLNALNRLVRPLL
jgi:pimeloyl-ACP methyl ester carboxylesterase